MVVGTAHIQGREFDGINDLNAFSVAAAVGMLAKVSLDRRVVLLAATRERRVAEIMEQMAGRDAISIVTHIDPELFERVAPFLSDARATVLRGAIAADSAIRRFAGEHRQLAGEPISAATLETSDTRGIWRRYENGTIYLRPDFSVGFLDEESWAALGRYPEGGMPKGMSIVEWSADGVPVRVLELESGALYLSELSALFVPQRFFDHYVDRGGAPLFGMPMTDARKGWVEFERGAIFARSSGIYDTTGAIHECFRRDQVKLGFPTGPEVEVSGRHVGLVQPFDHASVYMSDYGAFVVVDPIRKCFDLHGDARGELGFPVQEARGSSSSVVVQAFADGYIVSHPLGTFAVPQKIWQKAKGLGRPMSQPQSLGNGPDRVQFFERGVITVVDGVAKRWVPAE
jgi:hypothetical protein